MAFCKIFEKLMYKRVSNFLNSNILTGEHCGFRKNLSTDKALLSATEEILSAFNNKMHAAGISYDVAKAYDCVHVKWVHCHHGMARPRVADRGDSLQIWRIAANKLNMQSRTADSGWSSSLGIGRGANNPPP
jgi:hypothetical protein